ncbi:hypothetical protein B0H17DRAFT_1037933 [Mycena rosella]|uniref:Uncharacterized protein n=1 Tax=Mycena rosella TaxID=1033263 RepID=A0AAD7GU93_MYCRO|nr:hypothetical protein B0H17DRAFT_1037933 [Mycena rosella]
MPADPKNHFLWLIQPVLQQRADRSVFKPYLGIADGWGNVTCQEFSGYIVVGRSLGKISEWNWDSVTRCCWRVVCPPFEITITSTRSSAESRLTGKKYEDLINILGLCAAGYVPQLFSVVFPNPEVI